MSATNRKTIRKAIADLLKVGLVGEGKPVQAVYDHQVGDFNGQSPVVVVSSGGSLHEPGSFDGSHAAFWLNVQVFVLYASADGNWNEEDAEDALDDIDEAISGIFSDNQVSLHWQSITQDERSLTDGIEIGGVEYRIELISIRVE